MEGVDAFVVWPLFEMPIGAERICPCGTWVPAGTWHSCPPVATGWQCPNCFRCWGPSVAGCVCHEDNNEG